MHERWNSVAILNIEYETIVEATRNAGAHQSVTIMFGGGQHHVAVIGSALEYPRRTSPASAGSAIIRRSLAGLQQHLEDGLAHGYDEHCAASTQRDLEWPIPR